MELLERNNTMKKMNVLMLSVFFIALSANLTAQTRSRLSKVGFVDKAAIYNTVFEDKTLLGKIEAKFEREGKDFDELEAKMKQVNTDIATLKKDVAKAENPAAVEKQIADLEKELAKLDETHKKQAPIISMRKSKKNQAVQEEVNRLIAGSIMSITKLQGYTAILERKNETVLYVDREFDITTQVIAHVRSGINAMK